MIMGKQQTQETEASAEDVNALAQEIDDTAFGGLETRNPRLVHEKYGLNSLQRHEGHVRGGRRSSWS
jgi:hypothetical protein